MKGFTCFFLGGTHSTWDSWLAGKGLSFVAWAMETLPLLYRRSPLECTLNYCCSTFISCTTKLTTTHDKGWEPGTEQVVSLWRPPSSACSRGRSSQRTPSAAWEAAPLLRSGSHLFGLSAPRWWILHLVSALARWGVVRCLKYLAVNVDNSNRCRCAGKRNLAAFKKYWGIAGRITKYVVSWNKFPKIKNRSAQPSNWVQLSRIRWLLVQLALCATVIALLAKALSLHTN